MSNNLMKAKAQLILDQPFFASILLSLPMIEDSAIPTLATNGDEIRYNPEFLASLSLREIVFVLAHETMHCVFQHMHNRGTRNANRWNVAADYVINDLLAKDKVGTAPAGALLDSAIVQQGNGTTEGVYNILPAETEEKQAGDEGGALDSVEDASTDPAELTQKAAEMKVKVIQAANAAKMCGKLSAGLERIVSEVTETRIDWRSVLRRFLSERAKTDLSYARPKRRFLADDIYLPSLTGEKLGSIVIAVDCSGSIDQRVLDRFAAEVKGIIEDVSPRETHVIYFDSSVSHHDTFESGQPVEISAHGGGGTAFSPIFEFCAENGIAPTACVVLTDLYCSDFGDVPAYPVLWATTGATDAPFGEILKIKGE